MGAEVSRTGRYQAARKRVKEIRGFYLHLTTYGLINLFLIFINYITFWEFQWFWFSLLGWGIGLGAHWLAIFGYGRNWEEKKVREIMEKEEKYNKSWK